MESAPVFAAICEMIEAKGAVLLLNRGNALPLDSGANVTLFSINSTNFVYSGSGSGNLKVVEVRTWWQNAIVALQIGTGVLALASAVMLMLTIKKGRKK